MINRCHLARLVVHLWGDGDDYSALHKSLKERYDEYRVRSGGVMVHDVVLQTNGRKFKTQIVNFQAILDHPDNSFKFFLHSIAKKRSQGYMVEQVCTFSPFFKS